MKEKKNTRYRGMSMLWIIVAMTGLCAMASLAVDIGRVQIVKTELRRAADAAARAAASDLNNVSNAQTLATQYAAANTADGQSVTILPAEDVEFVNWDPDARTYVVLTGSARSTANGVRVTARRIASRNTSVPLMWGAVIGRSGLDVTASSVAVAASDNYGIIGLKWIKMSGNSSDSYWSSGGTSGSGSMGNIASNGNITLGGSASIHGNARPGPGMNVSGGTVTGTITPLTTPMSFAPGDAGPYATSNDNGHVPSWAKTSTSFALGKNKSVTLPGGTYYFGDFSTAAGSSLNFTGPATIYCYGNLNMGGNAVTNGSVPKNLKIIMCTGPGGAAPGDVSITGGSALYANIYAPQSNITMSGNGDLYGSLVGLSIDMGGTSAIHYDLASSAGLGGIRVVK